MGDLPGPSRQALVHGVAMPVVSGLILLVASAAAAAVEPAALVDAIPGWVPVAASSLLLGTGLGAGAVAARRPRRRRRGRRLLLLMPAFQQKDWLANLLEDLLRLLEASGVDLVVKIPRHEFDVLSQVQILDGVRRRRGEFDGALLIVADPPPVRADLVNFCRDVDFPVVFVDVRPFDSVDDYPPRTAFVGCSGAAIGELAAGFVARQLAAGPERTPSVLVVAGKFQVERQAGFERHLERVLPAAEVVVNDGGEFSRERARRIVEGYARRGVPDAIFCTNDEMALGALDALRSLDGRDPGDREPTVVGVDGTDQALSLIQGGRSPLRATVVQDNRRIAAEAFSALTRLAAGEPAATECFCPVTLHPEHESPTRPT